MKFHLWRKQVVKKSSIFWKKKRKSLKINDFRSKKSVQDESRTHTPNWALPPQSSASTNSATWTKKRAKDGTRTRDPDLGKVVLYQLSYFRSQFWPLWKGAFVNCGAKIQRLFELTKFFARKITFFWNYFFTPSRVKNSFWRWMSSNSPLYSKVIVVESCFSTPLIFMHMCCASA